MRISNEYNLFRLFCYYCRLVQVDFPAPHQPGLVLRTFPLEEPSHF